MKRIWYALALFLLITSMALAACGPAATSAATEEPGGEETEAPGGEETEAPGGEETEVPGGEETEVPGGETATDEPTPVPSPTIPPPVLTGGEGCDPAATKITWYIGLGAGTNAPVIPQEK